MLLLMITLIWNEVVVVDNVIEMRQCLCWEWYWNEMLMMLEMHWDDACYVCSWGVNCRDGLSYRVLCLFSYCVFWCFRLWFRWWRICRASRICRSCGLDGIELKLWICVVSSALKRLVCKAIVSHRWWDLMYALSQ